MESWFLADPDALEGYYGQGFQRNPIGRTADVERVPKRDVFERLTSATRATRKGKYDKVGHAPHLLDRLSLEAVMDRAPHCLMLVRAIKGRIDIKN